PLAERATRGPANPIGEGAGAVAGIAGTPHAASDAPPAAEPSAWPIDITEPLSASATGAPSVAWISRDWITGVIEKIAVAAAKIASATSSWLGNPAGSAWCVAEKCRVMATAWIEKPIRIQ